MYALEEHDLRKLQHYSQPAPPGSIIVRIVESGGEPFGFVREVSERDDADATFPSEQQPIEQVWRLVDNRLAANPDAAVYVEMETGVEWRAEWGELPGV